jgi:hypothetical protein
MKSLLTVVLLASLGASADPANSCADPYWKTTLRCALFPNEVPQPNLDDKPLGTNPAYTRVWIENEDVRCTDGTRPLLYVDKAICTNANGCGNGIRRGDPIESNRWIFSMTGGDSCNGARCAYFYVQPDERGFMGSSTKGAAKELEGIHEPDPVRNPEFASYNRVRVEKCSFDRYMGRSQEFGITATLPTGQTVTYDAYHHGFFIMQEAFKALQNGLRYHAWRRTPPNNNAKRRACCGPGNNEGWTLFQETLPPLANAESVLFIGHSNASHGLYHNIDHLAAELSAIPGFHADVRAFFDENFLPSVENEAAFATSAPANSDLYSSMWTGTSSAKGEPFSYDGAAYHATNDVDQDYAAHGAIHDRSCLDAHPSAPWMCRDRQHVLFNHVTTPFLVRQDVSDPNREHLDVPNGHWVRWGNTANYTYCPDGPPCEPRFSATEFRARVEKQMQTLLTHRWTRAEEKAAQTTMFAWLPDCAQHDGAYGDNFFDVTIATTATSFTLRQWLEEFLAAPRTGVRRWQIDDALDSAGRRMNTTKCN